jgi:hypothetical protein
MKSPSRTTEVFVAQISSKFSLVIDVWSFLLVNGKKAYVWWQNTGLPRPATWLRPIRKAQRSNVIPQNG